jgi:hypothetical protein
MLLLIAGNIFLFVISTGFYGSFPGQGVPGTILFSTYLELMCDLLGSLC